MKKSLIIFLISILPLIAISTSANASMFNRFKKGFYFEKYKTADEAKEELLRFHPIGSDVEGLMVTLKKAGMKCGPVTNPEFKDKQEYKNLIYCDYYKSKFVIFSTEWRVLARFDPKDSNIISFLEVHNFFHAL
jgi:hypothetical protein